jgi:threonyl-tRNA synthetase
MQMPKRFELKYTDKDGKEKTPLVIHRAIFGTLERFLGILLEHTKGRLPTWLAPIQVRVLSFTDRNIPYSEKIISEILKEMPNLRIDSDFRAVPLDIKVKDAELMRVPYIVVVGDKEEKEKNLAIRTKGDKKIKNLNLEDFIKNLRKEIETRAFN